MPSTVLGGHSPFAGTGRNLRCFSFGRLLFSASRRSLRSMVTVRVWRGSAGTFGGVRSLTSPDSAAVMALSELPALNAVKIARTASASCAMMPPATV